MDREIVEQLKQQRQDSVDAVSKELAWQEERCRVTLEKLESRSVAFLRHTSDIRNNEKNKAWPPGLADMVCPRPPVMTQVEHCVSRMKKRHR